MNHIIKYADDTTVLFLIHNNQENNYREKVKLFTDRWRSNSLVLKVKKTKEIVIDLRRTRPYRTLSSWGFL